LRWRKAAAAETASYVSMSLLNTRAAYGWVAIALHWISAIGVILLYFLGERMEDAGSRAQELAARQLHVSVGVLLFGFLAARLFSSAAQARPRPLERNRWLQLAARTVHLLFFVMIAVLIVSGPLTVWSAPRPLYVFDWFAIPSPFPVRIGWLHEAGETMHKAAAKLFWPLIVLHVGGALKHVVINRDGTLRRMLWPARAA
jgi:cytochrome b561